MSSFKFWQRRSGQSSSSEISGFDLFYQLTYMSAIGSAGVSRPKLFQLASELPCPPSRYFQEIDLLSKELGYSYPDACRIIGERAGSEQTRSFLLRLSDALQSGESLAPFLAREAELQGENYSNEYERKLDTLRKWTDAYASLIISVSLIVIINLISTMIYDMGPTLMTTLTVGGVVMGFFGAWIISRAAPTEVRSLSPSQGSSEQQLCLRLFRVLVPVTLAVCVILGLAKVKLGWLLILASLLLTPVGVMSYVSDKKIWKKDEEVSTFFRSLGGMASSTGTTIAEALTRIDLGSFTALRPDAKRLSLRFLAFVEPDLCLRRFGIETGSKLISQTMDIFRDAVRLGGDPERVGFLCTLFTIKSTMLRARRRALSSTFVWLSFAMHAAVATLMMFVSEIIDRFLSLLKGIAMGDKVGEATKMIQLPIPLLNFNMAQIRFLQQTTIAMILFLTLINVFALIATDGGHVLKAFHYLCFLLFMVGVSLLGVPPVVRLVL